MSEATEGGWKPLHSFHIDNGELDGLRLIDAFVLGVEWQTVRGLLHSGDSFQQTVYAENIHRLGKLLTEVGRDHKFTYLHDDKSETWALLTVEPRTEVPDDDA